MSVMLSLRGSRSESGGSMRIPSRLIESHREITADASRAGRHTSGRRVGTRELRRDPCIRNGFGLGEDVFPQLAGAGDVSGVGFILMGWA